MSSVKIGDVFIEMKVAKALALLERKKAAVADAFSKDQAELDRLDTEMNRLKTLLYAKFKDAIQLERGE